MRADPSVATIRNTSGGPTNISDGVLRQHGERVEDRRGAQPGAIVSADELGERPERAARGSDRQRVVDGQVAECDHRAAGHRRESGGGPDLRPEQVARRLDRPEQARVVTQTAAAARAPARPKAFQPSAAITGHISEPENQDM